MTPEEKSELRGLRLDLEMSQITVDQLKARLLSAETALEERDQKIMELRKNPKNSDTEKKKRNAQAAVDVIQYVSRHGRPEDVVSLLQTSDELKKACIVEGATDWEKHCAMTALHAIHYIAYNDIQENGNKLYNRIHLNDIIQDLKDTFIKDK